jgi:uncharacterized protein (TIGR00299 family) protein
MGAAGDMLAAALLELLPEPDAFTAELNALGIPGVSVSRSEIVKHGMRGTRFSVTVNGAAEDDCPDDTHRDLGDLAGIIGALPVSERVGADAAGVYRLIAEAEGRVHGRPAGAVHFHEVGALDAVADIVAVCLLMEKIAPDRVVVSPVCVGSGQVTCRHGVLPVPAPATALLLEGVPTFGGAIAGEMCTPTGAALLRYFAAEFAAMPVMRAEAIGCGMGSRDYGAANCVRAFWGDGGAGDDTVAVLKCNLDDMTPEALGFAQELLFEAGALDVYTVPIGMKKSRPGIQLCCLCREGDAERMAGILFRHTTTLGLRITREARLTMDRSSAVTETACGPVRIKKAVRGSVVKTKPEYEDLARIARENGLTLAEAAALTDKK